MTTPYEAARIAGMNPCDAAHYSEVIDRRENGGRTASADDVRPGMTVRIESGPHTGMEGVVRTVTFAVQGLGSGIPMVIINFEMNVRSVRPAVGEVTIINEGRWKV